MVLDPDAKIIILDNSTNTHISNNKVFVVGEIGPCQMNESCTTVGGGFSPAGTGIVEWSWKDDSGTVYTCIFPNTLYYPDSPVSIMAVTLHARSMNDLDGTFIKSQFY